MAKQYKVHFSYRILQNGKKKYLHNCVTHLLSMLTQLKKNQSIKKKDSTEAISS